MKKGVMSRLVGLLLIVFVLLSFSLVSVCADGLLPSLSEMMGIAMPSLGEALQRYPDSETENDDGSVTELYTSVSETDFSTFSVYLEQQGAELANYHVEGTLLTAEIRAKDAFFSLSYNSKSGEAKVTYPAGTFSEWIKGAKTHFNAAKMYLEEGKMDEAAIEFLMIPQYKVYSPVEELLQNDDKLVAAIRLATCRTPGEVITFGRYEQDNNMENGTEEIEWIVMDYDKQEHKALLLSKYGLDVKPYNEAYENRSWGECSLRLWLNAEFLQSAFSANEQAAILITEVDNGKSQGYRKWDTDGGNNTQDQIFLLSYGEASRYLNVQFDSARNTKSCVAPTAYAISQGAWINADYKTVDGDTAGFYWLRSPGSKMREAAYVNCKGGLGSRSVSYGDATVCPAFWIDLESDFFK